MQARSAASAPPSKYFAIEAPEEANDDIAEPDDEDFICNICREYPAKEVFQCTEGHIYCRGCYNAMIHQKDRCATCRTQLDRARPIRNRIAEKKISLLPAVCKNRAMGCAAKLTRGTQEDHEEKFCPYLSCECRAFSTGCTWKGFKKELEAHELVCLFVRFLPLITVFNQKINAHVKSLDGLVHHRLEGLEQRLVDCAEAHARLSGRGLRRKFERTFDFCLRNSQYGWVQHFMAFDFLWELTLLQSEGLGIKLKHLTTELPNTPLGLFSVSLECIHPSSDKLRSAFKYNQVEISSSRYLEEHCFLSVQQMRFFVKENGDIKINVKMCKHL